MTQDAKTFYVWIGGSCDYGHKERAGGAAVVIELMEQREQRGNLFTLCRVVTEEDEVKCCACVAHHREHGKLPHCLRSQENK